MDGANAARRGGTQAALPRGARAPFHFDGEAESEPVELPLGGASFVDRLADGRWLLAAGRAAPGERNGRLYDAGGRPAGTIMLGDAIEHLCCAPDGSFWVGYFDEGVFRGTGEGEPPVSAAGIAHFDADGRVLWRFNRDDPAHPLVMDCYAMVLAGNDLWACPYMDFPIFRIGDHRLTRWANRVDGAVAMAVDGNYVLLAGGYGDQINRLALLRLEAKRTRLVRQLKLPCDWSAVLFASGRDAILHLVAEGRWWRIGVGDLRARIRD